MSKQPSPARPHSLQLTIIAVALLAAILASAATWLLTTAAIGSSALNLAGDNSLQALFEANLHRQISLNLLRNDYTGLVDVVGDSFVCLQSPTGSECITYATIEAVSPANLPTLTSTLPPRGLEKLFTTHLGQKTTLQLISGQFSGTISSVGGSYVCLTDTSGTPTCVTFQAIETASLPGAPTAGPAA